MDLTDLARQFETDLFGSSPRSREALDRRKTFAVLLELGKEILIVDDIYYKWDDASGEIQRIPPTSSYPSMSEQPRFPQGQGRFGDSHRTIRTGIGWAFRQARKPHHWI